jgi:hypothetical protein
MQRVSTAIRTKGASDSEACDDPPPTTSRGGYCPEAVIAGQSARNRSESGKASIRTWRGRGAISAKRRTARAFTRAVLLRLR